MPEMPPPFTANLVVVVVTEEPATTRVETALEPEPEVEIE